MQTEYLPNNGFRSYWEDASRKTTFRSNRRTSKFLTGLQTFSTLTGRVLKDAGVELLFLLIFWLVITKMGQGRDLIVSLFEPDGTYGIHRIFFTILSVICLSVSMWIIPAFLFLQRDRKNNGRRFYRFAFKEHLFFAHRVLPLIPFWLLAYVLFNGEYVGWYFTGFSLLQLAALYRFNMKVKKAGERYRYAGGTLLLLIVFLVYFSWIYQKEYYSAKVVLAVILYLLSFLAHFIYHEADRQILAEYLKPDDPAAGIFSKYKINSGVYIALLVLHAAIVIRIFYLPARVSIAPESMILYIFSFYVFLIDFFVYITSVSAAGKLLIRLFVILLFLALHYSSVKLNLSHYDLDRISDSTVLKDKERLTFDKRLADLKERIILHSKNSNEPYPVILISGEGGGSRAGMWFSQNLINYDYYTSGRFRDYIFSLSTVSGSSVGLSTVFAFWDQQQKGKGIDTSWLYLPSEVYANNFVGRSVSGFLLTDILKSFFPWNSVTDRNSTLQDEESYYTQKACLEIQQGREINRDIPENDRILTKDFMGFFYDTSGGNLTFRKDRPLVFINTCRSNDGRRGIISPVKLSDDVFNDAIDIAAYLYEDSVCNGEGKRLCTSSKRNVSLGQACNMSELFPLFSAPAYIDSLGSFVDGGYHENSGLKTTLDVYQKLSDALRKDSLIQKDSLRYKIYIVYLKNGSSEKELYKPLPSETPFTLPIKALYSQPFEGSASYFEERTKFVNKKDEAVQYIEVKLNHRLLIKDSAINKKDGIRESQILRDLKGAIDTSKKEPILNFPLARWLSKSVIRRMGFDSYMQINASQPHPNDSLLALLNTINKISTYPMPPISPIKNLYTNKTVASARPALPLKVAKR